jgi:CubicO group peptidase (beta-lactamase class C family)
MSKSLVAVTVLLLQQRGLLSLDVHLGQYLACFDTAELRAKRGLTLRSVLCHTSGAYYALIVLVVANQALTAVMLMLL